MPNATLTDSNSIEYDANFPFPVTPVGAGPGGEAEVSIPDGADIALGSTTDDAYTGTEPYTAMSALRAIANAAVSTAASAANISQTGGNNLAVDDAAAGTTVPVPAGTIVQSTNAGYAVGDRGTIRQQSSGETLVAPSIGGIASTSVNGALGDGRSNTVAAYGLLSYRLGFNGTTWDRTRMNTAANGGAALMESGPYSRGRVTADGQIKGSAGFIHTLSIAPLTATPTAGLLTVYDSLTETGTVVYAEYIFATTPGHTVTLDIPCATGIYVGFDATLANVQVTVAYR